MCCVFPVTRLKSGASLMPFHGRYQRAVLLFVINHRKPSQANITEEELKKILGRFHEKSYHMEPVTTYHIVSNAIRKKDAKTWETLKKRYLDDNHRFNPLIQRVLKGNESASAMQEIRRLFPIHPYTAYLATFIARYLGSTERSIFNFLSVNLPRMRLTKLSGSRFLLTGKSVHKM